MQHAHSLTLTHTHTHSHTLSHTHTHTQLSLWQEWTSALHNCQDACLCTPGVANAACPVTPGHKDGVFSVSFSSDGTRVVSGSGDETVKIWDTTTGAEVSSFPALPHSGFPTTLKLTFRNPSTLERERARGHQIGDTDIDTT